MISIKQTCCFIGHRKVEDRDYIFDQVKRCIENLIINSNINTFLFGSRSQFADICLQVVTQLKSEYPNLIRVYLRAEYEYISADYEKYLLEIFDKTSYSKKAHNANRLVYIKRDEELIDNSYFCIFYYKNRAEHSGTAIAFDYANRHKRNIINIADTV